MATKREEIVKKAQENRKKKAEGITMEMLVHLLKEDLPYNDVHYIDKRTREIIEEAFKSTDFRDTTIESLRRNFLDNILPSVKAALPKPKKNAGKDETAERDNRCEATCHKLAELILERDILLDDVDTINAAISDDNRFMLESFTRAMVDNVYELLITSIDRSLQRANEKLWGVSKMDITFKNIDNLLRN